MPEIDDEIAPIIRGLYLVNDQGQQVVTPSSGQYELVIDVVDEIPPSAIDQSIYRLDVTIQSGEQITHWQQRFDRLSTPGDFISGATEIYRPEPITLADGSILANQLDPQQPRRFLYRMPIQLQADMTEIHVTVADFNGNQDQSTLTLGRE